MKEFHEESYEKHIENYKACCPGGERAKHAKTWYEADTVDSWRHQRMYQTIDPLLFSDPNSKWLTVGDGRCGNDAHYILTKGCSAFASDISDILLKEAKDAGYISDYKQENAESLSFSNSEFDYVLCKEAYHHFPRPAIALYEMLRVAKKGIILIEPCDEYIYDKILGLTFRKVKDIIKTLLRKKPSKHVYEKFGNYLYSISEREIEKVATGLNYKFVAFKGINDFYFQGVEYEKLADNGPLLKKIKRHTGITNLICRLGLRNYKSLSAIIIKNSPSDVLVRNLIKERFKIVYLPNCPYIKDKA